MSPREIHVERHPATRVPRQIGIVHLGLGAFHRAHQAVYLQQCLERTGDETWGVCSANIRANRTLVEQLRANDLRYHVAEYRDSEHLDLRQIGVIREALYAGPDGPDREALLVRMSDPAVRIVTLTVTEKGYFRDELGPDLVPDYLTSVQEGGFYGWPYSYWGQHVDPRVRPQDPAKVESAIAPDYSLGSHRAPLGVAFSNPAVGGEFSDGVFVSEHGSWNRADPVGYKVVFIPFENGKPAGDPVDFVSGFLASDDTTRGRPVGVSVAPDGAVIIADDLTNAIWRVTPDAGVNAGSTIGNRDGMGNDGGAAATGETPPASEAAPTNGDSDTRDT